MTDTNTNRAEQVLFAIADLLLEYRDQARAAAQLQQSEMADAELEPEPEPEPEPEVEPELSDEADIAVSAPWERYVVHDPNWKKSASVDISPILNAKIQWVMDNVPKISQRKLIMAGAEVEADRLIALHYKPGR